MKSSLFSAALLSATMLAGCATQTAVEATAPAAPSYGRTIVTPVQAEDSYYTTAQARVSARAETRGAGQARNVIIFVGDGMGISTITAARIYAGQSQGLDGESYQLTMETFPNVALSKTYSDNFQTADSAATAVAMMTGVKTDSGTLGFDRNVQAGNCAASLGHEVESLFSMAEAQDFSTGVVSTARITHATPAATYSHSPSRDWEFDGAVGAQAGLGCRDIASQLIDFPAGDGLELAMGGGRSNFMTNEQADPEYEGRTGRRGDGRDLVAEWSAKSDDHTFIYDQAGFDAINFDSDVRVLGLFEPSHMQFEQDRPNDTAGEPSLSELTEAAITRLSRDEDGFVLMVEGGRIDHAHHGGNAHRALVDAVAFDDAIRTAVEMTDASETMILVTADHSHTMTIAGYAARGNPILGLARSEVGALLRASDGRPYTTLGYANGPGAVCTAADNGACERGDLTDVDVEAPDYQQQSTYPMGSETHGGEDVAIFATGAGSERVGGVMEQNEIFFALAQSLGLVD
ncbi:alkaline phosphatase [Ponticaulis sp.]|uniref:alkaline phosphatase n=1 Tax=Ponticaulis sp. TaxID=2020902 RepID=UPI000C412449|nr:alkaline phosphatase [Ponticaulis sp.]MBN04901.1 alkaline phosphatase [Ponticaulis sp.]